MGKHYWEDESGIGTNQAGWLELDLNSITATQLCCLLFHLILQKLYSLVWAHAMAGNYEPDEKHVLISLHNLNRVWETQSWTCDKWSNLAGACQVSFKCQRPLTNYTEGLCFLVLATRLASSRWLVSHLDPYYLAWICCGMLGLKFFELVSILFAI